MDEFCGSRFWNFETVWNTDDPDLTLCFEKTVFVWIPCAFLWILLPFEIYLLRCSESFDIPWNTYNVTKLIAIKILAAIPLKEIFINIFFKTSYFPVDLYSPLIKYITLLLFFGLTYANVKFGRRSSGILFLFSLLLTLFGAFQFRTEIRLRWSREGAKDLKLLEFISHIVYHSLVVVVFIMNCFADASPRITARPYDKNACPRKKSSFLSRILFAWFEPLVWKGYKKSLENDDLWTLDSSIASSSVVPRFEKHWNKSWENLKRSANLPTKKTSRCEYKFNNKNKKVSIVPALWRTFGFTFILATLMRVFFDVFLLVNPGILGALIDFIDSDEPTWKGYLYAVLLFIVSILQTIAASQYDFTMQTVGLRIRACLISMIYKKTLRISNGARKNFTVGETVNLMSVDAYRFVDVFLLSYMLFSAPLQLILVTYFLWQILGPSTLAGLVVIIISILINSYLASRIKSLQIIQMKKKDERVKLLSQILFGIKVLKLYAWEPSFEKKVSSIRNQEIKVLKKQAYLESIAALIWSSTSFLLHFATFAVFLLLNEKSVLNAKLAFVSLSLFNILKYPMLKFPGVLSDFAQTSVSIKRIDGFLNSEDLGLDDVSHEKRPEPLVIENGSFSWDGSRGKPTLRNINLKINSGALVAVVGPVGCGKSSLISAFLGELYKISGYVNITGTIAYVPQQAWIRNASVRDNITFGEPVDSSYYDKVLGACALKPDLKILPAGDSTEIGEKGINLSGGQKQRLSMARAVYNRSDVYLLDDPLSAVDSHVGKHIFEQVIGPNGLLKNKTRVWVTHSVTYLSQVDLIVVMKDGSISESGTFEELMNSRGEFSEFLVHYLEENEECAEEDFDRLVHTLKEKNLPSEKFVRQRSIRSESNSIGSFNRQRSMNSKRKALHRKQNSVKETIAGEKLVVEEHTETGNINWRVYMYFVRSAGTFVVFLVALGHSLGHFFSILSNMWLSKWTDDASNITSEGNQNIDQRNHYILIYAILGLSYALLDGLSDFSNRIACLNSGKFLHNAMLGNLFRLPLSFMDVTPSGRILSRFSKDIDVVDNTLPTDITSFLYCLAETVSSMIIVSFSTPAFIPVVIPMTVFFGLLQRFYVCTSRQLKRLESVSRSPIYSHFIETFIGSQSIRAYGLSEKFSKQSEEKVDTNHQSYHLNLASNRWLSIRSEFICNIIIFLAAFFVVLNRESISPGIAGMSVACTLQITLSLNWMIYKASETETNIVSIERMKELIEVPQEAAWQIPAENVPPMWPSKGEICFQDFKVRYREGLELVLKGISFFVNGGQKIGIVGRTGAGKSSLTLSLFRILESAGGKIIIDGIDIATIGLHTVRSRLTIIPQDPVVFAGSLRMNLDPFEEHSDDNLWHALELAHLKSYISSLNGGLRHEVTEGGENFSVGQRQLICLARALLRKTKILILDEATAAVDLETDDLIQSTIREEFKNCTVLTIAHRLNTVMDYDKILVFDQGYVVEYDSPEALLESKNSLFYRMAADAGLV